MSGGAQTSVSGMRAPGASRRGETRRQERWVGFGWSVHIVILALAVLLWWIARDMVAVSQQLKDAGRVRFELSESLQGEWRIFSQTQLPVTLDVSGPTKEINEFAAELDQNPGRFAYRYEITPADIERLVPDRRQQIQLTADIRSFQATSDAVVPAELTVRPLGGERVFVVTLERFIQRDAHVDLGPGSKGQIQVTLNRRDGRTETRAYAYTAEVNQERAMEVWGPASLVEANTDSNGLARLKVSIDARQVLDNFAKSENLTVEQVLEQGSVLSIVQLLPIDGVEVRDKEQRRPVATVPVKVNYSRLQDYVQVSDDFDVEVVFPNWLAQKSARVENLPTSIPVALKILSSQRPDFTAQNVHVRLDLSSLNNTDLEIQVVEGTNIKRAKVLNWYYSLDINTERLTYEFFNENVTADQYLPIGEITIAWTE
ncbi:MAG: hypothetical protein H6841_09235 [Planctomycetes bacterium]|nr:hypothetical protein [Planctomycetota bacterium]MCB9936416.1 hypothetical protein [Planctomycetota bacterium]